MYRLISHFLSIGSLVSFSIFVFSIILVFLRKRVGKKVWRALCFVPLVISIIHYIVYFVPGTYIVSRFLFMYIFSCLLVLLQFFYGKKIFKFSSIIIIILGFISFISVFYKTIELENIHNLYYYNYTDSFDKAISIFKKEYVLNEHKKIDYDQLRKKYYPALEQAEKNHDERLYY